MRIVASLFLALLLWSTVLPAWAAYPTVGSTTSTTDIEGDTTVLNMPASIAAGDLLLQACGHQSGSTILSQTGGADWTRIVGTLGASLSRAVFAKIAAGGDTITVDGFLNGDTACSAVRIPAGEHGVSNVATDITVAANTATGTNPDPSNVNPGVSADYLVLIATLTYAAVNVTVQSTGYTETVNSGAGLLARSIVSQKNVTASSEDPSAQTLASSNEYHVVTMAIPPSSGTCNGGMTLLGAGKGC